MVTYPRYLASANLFRVMLWETATGSEVQLTCGRDARHHTWFINGLAFSSDGRHLASGSWPHLAAPAGLRARVSFSPGGAEFITVGEGDVRVWNIAALRRAVASEAQPGEGG